MDVAISKYCLVYLNGNSPLIRKNQLRQIFKIYNPTRKIFNNHKKNMSIEFVSSTFSNQDVFIEIPGDRCSRHQLKSTSGIFIC